MSKANYSEELIEDWKSLLESDIETLIRLVIRQREPLDEGSIRAASPILRRWLVEGLLGKLCRGLEVKPTLPALNNAHVISALEHAKDVTCFITGGVRFNGAPVCGIYMSELPYTSRPPIPVDSMEFELMKLGAFVQQKRVFYRGDFFTCEDIIKFVANKLGGVHHDTERDERHKRMEAAADAITFGGPPNRIVRGKIGQSHLVVEPKALEPLNAFHVEVIAAAASLLHVHLNGDPLIDFKIEKSIPKRVLDFFGVRQRIFGRSLYLVERP